MLTDGMRVGWNELRSAWRLPIRALGWGYPLSLLFMTGLGHVLIGLPWTEALLLGAALAPTDPVFAAAVVGNERVPEKLRHMLNVESGVNDGLALPFVVVLLQLAERDDIDATKIVMELVIGVAIGVGVPWLAVKLERLRFLAAAEQHRAINVVAITLLVFALAKSLHGNLYLAAFAAGVTMATVGEPEREAFHEFGDMAAEPSWFIRRPTPSLQTE